MDILGLIPARGGSKGIPKKNIYRLCGKPMISYAIDKALKSKYINRLIVSTDDNEIANIAKEYGAEVPFIRPSSLARDTSPTLPVVKHTIDWLRKNNNYIPDITVVLQANSPLMQEKDIDRVIEKLIKTGSEIVYTVKLVDHPPQWLQTIENDIPFFVFNEERIESLTRRQDIKKKIYRSTGTISAVNTDYLLRNYHKKPRIVFPLKGQKTRVIVLDSISSIDIDNWLDLCLVESIMKNNKLKNNLIWR